MKAVLFLVFLNYALLEFAGGDGSCNATLPCLTYFTYWNGYCYRGFSTNFYTAMDIDKLCQKPENSPNQTGHLISIHSEFENRYLTDLIDGFANEYLIGLYYNGSRWIHFDGTPVDFVKWAPGQPLDPDNNNCTKATMIDGDFSYKWITTQCDQSESYICKYPAITY